MLQGTLQEFSLPDVFQLLTLTRKSGSLLIHGDGQQGRVAFHRGEVSFAVSDVRRMPLGARLVGAGLVSDEQLAEVLAAHRGGGPAGLSKALLDAGTVDQKTLHTFLREQIQDSVSTLMRLADGSFAFEAGDALDDGGVTMATDELIEEGERRVAEWATIRESLPSLDAVLGMCPALPNADREVSIAAAEWQLLTLVDGTRRVRDVIELTGMGEHATGQVLDGLVRKGLVEALDPAAGESGALAKVLARRDALRRLEHSELGAEPPAPSFDPAPAPSPTPDEQAPGRFSRINVPSAEALLAQVGPDPAAAGPADSEPSVDTERGPDEAEARQIPESLQVTDATDATEATEPTPAPPVHRPLTRDEDVNKGLLLRLIDGVKGA